MKKEIGYVWQGFFLLLVVLAGMGMVQVLGSIDPAPDAVIANEGFCGINTVDEAAIKNPRGARLFKDNCATCHTINKDLTGPALRGIEDRVKDKRLLYTWIRNNAAVLKSGNPYFTELYKRWNKTPMNVFPILTDEEITDILSYIRQKKESKSSPAPLTVME